MKGVSMVLSAAGTNEVLQIPQETVAGFWKWHLSDILLCLIKSFSCVICASEM